MNEAFVLAGGASRRMGTDKARIAWPGRWPMAAWVAAVLARAVARVAIVRSSPDVLGFSFPVEAWVRYPGAPIPVVLDEPTLPRHPLSGVATALSAAEGPLVLVAAVDLPELTEAAVRAVLAPGAPVVATGEGGRFGLLAVLSTADAPRALRLARAGAGFRDLIAGLPEIALGGALSNLNTPPAGGPIATFSRRFGGIDSRMRAGEVARLAARGAVDPGGDAV